MQPHETHDHDNQLQNIHGSSPHIADGVTVARDINDNDSRMARSTRERHLLPPTEKDLSISSKVNASDGWFLLEQTKQLRWDRALVDKQHTGMAVSCIT